MNMGEHTVSWLCTVPLESQMARTSRADPTRGSLKLVAGMGGGQVSFSKVQVHLSCAQCGCSLLSLAC